MGERVYEKRETQIAIAKGREISSFLSPKEKEFLLGVLMGKIILDEANGVTLLSELIAKVKVQVR